MDVLTIAAHIDCFLIAPQNTRFQCVKISVPKKSSHVLGIIVGLDHDTPCHGSLDTWFIRAYEVES
jgi:hypothetical protein